MMTPDEAALGRGAAMRDTDLFRMALGIEPPWVVTKSQFDAVAKRLDIHLGFAKGSRFACSECGFESDLIGDPGRRRGGLRRHWLRAVRCPPGQTRWR
jgi:hypothetical protein